jgi:hypothetical protein
MHKRRLLARVLTRRSHPHGDKQLRSSLWSGHVRNVFCAKFMPHSGDDCVATTAADGDVRLLTLSRGVDVATARASQRAAASARLFNGGAAGMGMKLAFLPSCAAAFLSTHQDGRVRFFDTRAPPPATPPVLVSLGVAGAASDLVFDPGNPSRFALGSEDPFVRLYDMRRMGTSGSDAHGGADADDSGPGAAALLARFVPAHITRAAARRGALRGLDGVSGLAWGAQGTLFASYRGADVYSFDARDAATAAAAAASGIEPGGDAAPPAPRCGVLRRFRGRRNERTFLKGLALMCDGTYVVAGGDCGCVYVWHARSGALAARIRADAQVLNAVAPHPHGLPLLAVSGIDDDAKIIAPGDTRAHAWRAPRRRGDAAAAEAAARELHAASDSDDDEGGSGFRGFGGSADDASDEEAEDEADMGAMSFERAIELALRRRMRQLEEEEEEEDESGDDEEDEDEDEDEEEEEEESESGSGEAAGGADAPGEEAGTPPGGASRRRPRREGGAADADAVADTDAAALLDAEVPTARGSPRQRRSS